MIKELLLLAGGTILGGLFRSEYEKKHFVTETTTIRSSKIKQERTLVFLSDLHNKEFGEKNKNLLAAIDAVQPDAVLIGGDTMVIKRGDEIGLSIMMDLVSQLVKRYPVYYANGNHEQRLSWEPEYYGSQYQELGQFLKHAGAHYLSDCSELLGTDIRISGLNISKGYYKKWKVPKMDLAYIRKRLGEADSSRFQILLAHSPLFFSSYAKWGADLALAGHFHGGTIRLPVLGGVMTPQFQFFSPWCAGSFERDGKRMLVSRGLGTHSINIRINDRPQVMVIRLEKSCD